MDPLSHALLGAASGLAISRSTRRMAALAGAAGALLPDADVLIRSGSDPLLTLEYHRQFTHSIIAAPVGALVVAGLLWLPLRRHAGLRRLYWPALAGFLSALLLDACTSYGTQLLWPFTDRRFAASIVAVVDPLVTLVLLAGVVLAWRAQSAQQARAAISLVLVYLGIGWIQRERVEAVAAHAAAARGHVISRHEVKPTLGNLLLWRSVYRHEQEYIIDAVRAGLSASRLYPGGSVRHLEALELTPPLRPDSVQASDVARFARVSEGYLARHPSLPHVIGDVRYSMLPDSTRPLWGIEIDPQGQHEHVAFRTFRDFNRQERQRFLAMLRGIPPEKIGAWAANEGGRLPQ